MLSSSACSLAILLARVAIGIVQNGTHVTLEELNSDRQWRKVKTKDGKSVWVWAEFVAFSS